MNAWFDGVARRLAAACGRAGAFIASCALVLVWLLTGPLLGFSDTWQLLINTPTTVITFLVLFLVQNTQNRDAQALHAKLDELISALDDASDDLQHIEDSTEAEIAERRP